MHIILKIDTDHSCTSSRFAIYKICIRIRIEYMHRNALFWLMDWRPNCNLTETIKTYGRSKIPEPGRLNPEVVVNAKNNTIIIIIMWHC